MKKSLFCVLVFWGALFSGAQSLNGIWENQHRLIEFGPDSATFVLKLFYGWYYDRSATLSCQTSAAGSVTEAELVYPSYKISLIYPLAVSGDMLFLDFYLHGSAFGDKTAAGQDGGGENGSAADTIEERLRGFWRPGGNRYEISIDAARYKNEVYGYFFTDTHAYRIRYWLTEMPYDDVAASVIDGAFSFTVDKYLKIGAQVYTCVTGRGTSVRNVEKDPYKISGGALVFSSDEASSFPLTFSADAVMMSFSAPYLQRTSIENLNAEIDAMNARRRPPPKPIFPPSGFEADFYWEEIQALRSNMGELAQLVLTNQLFTSRRQP